MTGTRSAGQQLRFLADEDLNFDIVSGIRLRNPAIDMPTVQELGMDGTPDPGVLEYAAQSGRIVVSHDTETMRGYAYERITAGLPMPGVFLVRQMQPIGPVIDEILLLAVSSIEGEWENRVEFLPAP